MTNNTKMRLGSAEYTNVHLNSIEYNSFSENLFTLSFPDALKFIFKDYRNLKAYPSFEEYVYHYESDIMKAYNMPAYYQYQDINYFLKNILDKKNELSYQNLLDFLNTKDIKSGNGEQFSFSELEKAKHYFILGNYDKSLSIFEHILSKLEGPERNNRDLADTFFNNIEYALMSYGETKQEKSIFDILEKIIDILPAYILESYYLMAKYSDKYEFLEVKGESALDYCYKYYHDNPLFTKKDLSKIKF
jgi:tetratricopeptide (TPR) repeat protein